MRRAICRRPCAWDATDASYVCLSLIVMSAVETPRALGALLDLQLRGLFDRTAECRQTMPSFRTGIIITGHRIPALTFTHLPAEYNIPPEPPRR